MELRQPRKPSRGAIASPRRGRALTMLDEATRTELLDRLRAQEEAQLPYGAWVYQVWNAGASELPATFDSARFTAGLDTLTATPSYRELVADTQDGGHVQSAVPSAEIGGHVPSAVPGATTCTPISDPLSWVVLQQDETTVTLLGLEQFYAFDGAGRVCHEFVRYIAQPNGTVLAQEIVKRVFDPADGGRELVIRETVGSAGSLWAAPQHETSATTQTRVRRHCQPPAGGSVPSAPWISVGLDTYDVLWQVGDADSGRLVLQGEKDGETARLVLDEMGTTMTKELTDWQTGLRFHQGSTLAASEMQWFPADAAEGNTVVRVDEWLGMETDGSRNKPKSARKVELAAPLGIPRAAIRTTAIDTAQLAARSAGYYADLFDMALGLNDAVYALPTADTTVTVEDTSDDDSESSDDTALTEEESETLSSLADDLLNGLLQATGGCGTEVSLTVTRTAPYVEVTATGGHLPCYWVGNTKTFTYLSLPGYIDVLANTTAPYTFKEWTGDVQSTNPSVSVCLTTNKAVTANLNEPVTLTISIAKGDAGNSTTPAVGEHLCALNSTVQVAATASEQYYQFIEWTGDVNPQDAYDNPVDILMSSDKDIAANFEFAMPMNSPGINDEHGIKTYWLKIEDGGFATYGYKWERFVHLCTGTTWDWQDEEVGEEFVNITCDKVTLDYEKDIKPIQESNSAHWETVWRTGSQIGLTDHPYEVGYWLVKENHTDIVGDVFILTTPPSILTYFHDTPGRQEAVLYMDQQFISKFEEPGPPPKVLWTCHCALRFIEIFPQDGGDPGDTVMGYDPQATSHMITDKDGKHIPEGEPSQYYDVWGWPPPQNKPVGMPDIIDWLQADAEARLFAADFSYSPPTLVSHPTIANGNVCGQDPAAGSRIPYKMTVSFSVSTGP